MEFYNKKIKKKLLLLVGLSIGFMGFAQQDAQYTQYMYNTININPAYAGSRDVMGIFGLYRTQWVGIDGAPNTAAFSINSPLGNNNWGMGLSFVNDKIGATDESTISLDLSYAIKVSETFKLALGLKGTGNLFNLDVNKLDIEHANDPQFYNLDNTFSSNLGAGLYLYSNRTYIGISAPNLFEATRYNDNEIEIYKERPNFYFIAGHVVDLGPSVQFKPAVLTKVVEGAPLQVDVSGNFLIHERLVLGAAYRWSAAISAMAGFQITDGFFIGYGYDYETTDLSRYNSGSHELFLRFELFNRYSNIIAPRFF
ncbi:MAG: type IX secretion system membrane protein PorP/SprF [Sediminicola sp.]|tara:strand:+ start:14125 stop:15057 length:933 start_codon:yes stop_codon:yes gene_type:complete